VRTVADLALWSERRGVDLECAATALSRGRDG
jgi:hypothetical protein